MTDRDPDHAAQGRAETAPAQPASLPRRCGAAQGVMLAVLLSAPVWLGIGAWVWRLTQP